MSDDSPLTLERDGDLATITLDRPDHLNSLDEDLLERLQAVTTEVGRDDAIRVVVITGAGKAFCAGGDLRVLQETSPEDPGEAFYRYAGIFHDAIVQIRSMSKAVLAAINGPAVGGGFSLALACDLRLISSAAYLRVGYTSSGLTFDGGGSFMLPRLVGLGRATEMAFLDEEIAPDDAEEYGLVNRVVAPNELQSEAQQTAERLAAMPTEALGRMKRLYTRSFDSSLEEHLERERRAIAACAGSEEGQEGIQAFLEKRQPNFRTDE